MAEAPHPARALLFVAIGGRFGADVARHLLTQTLLGASARCPGRR